MFKTIEEVTKAANHNKNPRRLDNAVNRVKIANRVQSILDKGLLHELVINKRSGRMECGHIRAAAISVIHNTMADEYAKHFPKGVPVIETDHSDNEEEIARNDHGETESLEALEVCFSAKALFNAGLKYTKVIIQLVALFFSASGKKVDLAEQLEKGDQSAQGQRDIIVAFHKGKAQLYQRLSSLPQQVEDIWVANREGVEADFKIREVDIKNLDKQFKLDAKDNTSVNREIPGKLYREEWVKVVAAGLKRKVDGGVQDSSKWTPTIIRHKAEGCNSAAVKGLLYRVINDEKLGNGEGLPAMDKVLFMLETVERDDPDFYSHMITELEAAFVTAKDNINEAQDAAVSA